MRYNAQDYSILVGRDRVTGEFVAIVREFPSLSWVSEVNRSLAAQGMRGLLADVLADIYADGEVPPAPARYAHQLDSTEALRELTAV